MRFYRQPVAEQCGPGCEERAECRECDRPLCGEHSPDFDTCDDGEWHLACHQEACIPCMESAAHDKWAERI